MDRVAYAGELAVSGCLQAIAGVHWECCLTGRPSVERYVYGARAAAAVDEMPLACVIDMCGGGGQGQKAAGGEVAPC